MHSADLCADLRHSSQQPLVRLQRLGRKELEHGNDLCPDENREREGGAEAVLAGGLLPRKVRVVRHVGDPRRSRACENATGEPDAGRKTHSLRKAPEALEAQGVVQVPDAGGHELGRRAFDAQAMAHRPSGMSADAVDCDLDRVFDRPRQVRGHRNALEQDNLGLAFV